MLLNFRLKTRYKYSRNCYQFVADSHYNIAYKLLTVFIIPKSNFRIFSNFLNNLTRTFETLKYMELQNGSHLEIFAPSAKVVLNNLKKNS